MDNDEKKMKIEYLIAHKNNLWTGVIILSGGLAGILLTADYSSTLFSIQNIVRISLFFLGLFFLPLMMTGLINTNYDIKNTLK